MVGPEAFTEVRYLAHYRQMQALWLIPELAEEFEQHFGRAAGGSAAPYHTEAAETLVVALGSVNGTIKDVVDQLNDEGVAIGCVSITSFRPFPARKLRETIGHARRVVVIEKSLAVGIGGIVSTDVRMALAGAGIPVFTVIAGLGGRAITQASLHDVLTKAHHDALQRLTFLDLRRTMSSIARSNAWRPSAARARWRKTSCVNSAVSPTTSVKGFEHAHISCEVLSDRDLHRRQPPAQ